MIPLKMSNFTRLGQVVVLALFAVLAFSVAMIVKLTDEPWDRGESYQALADLSCGVDPPLPFTTDGCSVWPDGDWAACCVVHDIHYWCGGGYLDRVRADADLARCVGAPLGWAMFLGVQAGGVSILPTPFRWGYGWPWPGAGP